jgi:hypothetical protein
VLRAFHARGEDPANPSDGHYNWVAREMGQSVVPSADRSSRTSRSSTSRRRRPAGLYGPEFGIMDANTALRRANFVNQFTFWGGIAADYERRLAVRDDARPVELELLAPVPRSSSTA